MAFSGFSTSNYVRILTALSSGQPLTLAAWVYSTSTATQNIIVNNAPTNASSVGIALSGSSVIAYTNSAVATTTSNYSINQWQHICAVFASTTNRSVFLNGGSKGTNTALQATVGLDRTNIGVFGSGTTVGDPLIGQIAEVGIWNVALEDSEVASLFKGFTPAQIRPQSLVAYLPLIRTNQDIKGNEWTTVGSLTAAGHPRIYS